MGESCQIKPLSKDKHQSDPGCHGSVITAPKIQAEHYHILSGQMGDSILSPISHHHLEGINTIALPHRPP